MPEFIIPKPNRRTQLTMSDGAIIRLRQYGNKIKPRLVLCHGNGFAIDAYFPFWKLLVNQFDLILYDQRNHGQNPFHSVNGHRLKNFVSDMEEVFNGINQQFGNKPAIGVFHSISAVTAIKHALEFGKKWQALILFDPALVPGPGLSERDVGLEFELKLVKWAKNRPDGISNYRDLADNFSRAKTLKRWVPGAYELMAKSIMHRDNKVKKWFLNCPGIAESKIYEDNSKTHLTGFISELSVPVKFICADPNQPDALAPSKVGQAIHKECDISYVAIPNTSHLLQIEKPKECALALTSFINKLKIRS